MTTKLIDGKDIAKTLRNTIKKQVQEFQETHRVMPGLAIIMVGDDPASNLYVRNKQRHCENVGIHSEIHRFPLSATFNEIKNKIEDLNHRDDIHGMLIQLPLPNHLDARKLLELVNPQKDVDGLHSQNIAALHTGQPLMVPCTPLGIRHLLLTVFDTLEGLHIAIIGRSQIVGKPLAALLLSEHCTITHIHSRSKNWQPLTQQADVIVMAAGVPGLLKGEAIKENAVVIDVGSNRITKEDKSIAFVGDVDIESVSLKARYISPVPGGVGPMTVAYLLKNTLDAALKQVSYNL